VRRNGVDHLEVTRLRLRLAASPRGLLTLAIAGVLAVLLADCFLEFAPDLVFVAVLVVLLPLWARARFTYERDLDRDLTKLERMIDSIPLATVALDADERVLTWNGSAERLFGWRAADVIGERAPYIPDDQRGASSAIYQRLKQGERLRGVEVLRRARDGRDLELAVYSAPLSRESVIVLYDDVSERKQAERDRDLAERQYQELIESLPLVTFVDLVDERARNVYTSPQAVEMLGWSLDDWRDDPNLFLEILHPEDRNRVLAAVAHSKKTREEFDGEYRLRHRDGTYVWVRDRSTIVETEDGLFSRGFLIDITQQKRLEEQLMQAQKMDALGQLAGGIAHDFNNLLTGISGYADLALTSTEPDSPVDRCIAGIKAAASEAASLTSRLLAFSRRNVPERRLVDLNELVVEAAGLLERLVRADVRVQLELAQPLPHVAADLAQLKQVVLNLALNARDAMPNGGTLTIETAPAPGAVVLRVRDSGEGMDASTRSRAVEPFFTTKSEGEGTGLGLSVVYGVVDSLDGRLSIESAPGLGTIVEITLPAADGIPEPTLDERPPVPAAGVERVLVVEDRAVVRQLARDVLEASGFEVAVAAGGAEALDAVASQPPFDVLVTDVVMPEMSGAELAQALRADRPELPVVFMSGYTDDVLGNEELSQPGTSFVRKPFANAELVTAVRGAIDYWESAALAKASSSPSVSTG
jgi:two-component system cell cycle sensor histidine kinase/response regulator CckA